MEEKGRKPLVLIVEDDPNWQESFPDLFKPLNVRIKIAATLRQGLEIAEQYPPDSDDPLDLIILDMFIPRNKGQIIDQSGGVHFLKEYGYILRLVPVICFTAYESYDNCVEVIKAGAYNYIPKTDLGTGANNAKRLLECCQKLLVTEEEVLVKERDLPDEEWFERHHQEVRRKYSGKCVAFVPKMVTLEKKDKEVSCEEMYGVKVLSADSNKKMRWYILDNPELRELLPLVVLIE
jgi:CheY-like chemotaxis protein